MIEDINGGSQGALIDWEFTASIMSDNLYTAGGTVSSMHVREV
jgi:hypothetical protein